MTRDEARAFMNRALGFSNAEDTFILLTAQDGTAVPFSHNRILSPVSQRDASVQITVRNGKRYATVTGNRLDDSGLRALFERAQAMASLATETESELPFPDAFDAPEIPLSKMKNAEVPVFRHCDAAVAAIDMAKEKGVLVTGKVSTSDSVTAVADKRGLFLYQPSSMAHAQVRAITSDGQSSGYSEARARDFEGIDPHSVAYEAINKCLTWREPSEIAAGRLTTIFEPQAVADIMMHFLRQFDQQAISGNRSFLRKLDGGSFVGSELFPKGFDILSDPVHPAVPSFPFTLDGMPVKKRFWVKNGVVETVSRSRLAAQREGGEAIPFPTNVVLNGSSEPIESMIGNTKRGLLVSGMGSLMVEDPANCLLTGSTKDGLFLIEGGRIVGGAKNMILRETAVYLFRSMDMAGPPVPVHPRGALFPMLLPAMRIPDVKFTGLSGIV
jgi:predicted Zn-dependent protease